MQPYPVDPSLAICDDHTYIPTVHSIAQNWQTRETENVEIPKVHWLYQGQDFHDVFVFRSYECQLFKSPFLLLVVVKKRSVRRK